MAIYGRKGRFRPIVALMLLSAICWMGGKLIYPSTSFSGQVSSMLEADDQPHRLARIQRVCESHKLSRRYEDIVDDGYLLNHLFYSDEHKLLYCLIPKSGCTNWMRIFMVLNKKLNRTYAMSVNRQKIQQHALDYDHSPIALEKLAHVKDKAERLRRIKDYYKFTYVRDPINRLIASYKIYKGITQNKDKSFTGLVNQLLEEHAGNKVIDGHYQHFHRLCRPCSITYDYVGKFENLPDEANDVLKQRKLDHLVTYRNPEHRPTKNSATANLTNRDKYIISTLYNLDYELFGYERKMINKVHNMES